MWLYNVIFFILIIGVYFEIKNKNILNLIVIIFWILSFIRWESGTDWDTYLLTFKSTSVKEMIYVNEIGFKYLNYFIKKINNNYTFMLVVEASILFYFKYSVIYKFSKNKIFSILISFATYKGDIFFTRQSIAVALTMYSVKYIFQKRLIKFIFIVIIASLIHRSAISFIIAYPLLNYLKIGRKRCFFIILMSVISIYFNEEIIKLSIYLLDVFSGDFGRIIAEKLESYLLRSKNVFGYRTYMSKEIIILINITNRLLVTGIMLFYYKKLDIKTQKMINLYSISFFIMSCFGTLSLTLARLTEYYQVFEIIVLANIYNKLSRKLKVTIFPIIVLYYYLKLISWLSSYYSCYVPYKTIF